MRCYCNLSRLFSLYLGQGDSQHPSVERGLNLFGIDGERQFERPGEITGPAFPVVESGVRYVTAIITEKGAFKPEDLHLLHNGTPEQIEMVRIK